MRTRAAAILGDVTLRAWRRAPPSLPGRLGGLGSFFCPSFHPTLLPSATGRIWGRPGRQERHGWASPSPSSPPSPLLAPSSPSALRSKMAALSSSGSAEGASLFNGDMEPEPPPPGPSYAGGSGSAGGDSAIPEEVRAAVPWGARGGGGVWGRERPGLASQRAAFSLSLESPGCGSPAASTAAHWAACRGLSCGAAVRRQEWEREGCCPKPRTALRGDEARSKMLGARRCLGSEGGRYRSCPTWPAWKRVLGLISRTPVARKTVSC